MATQNKIEYTEDVKADPFTLPEYTVPQPDSAPSPAHSTVASPHEERYQETADDESSDPEERSSETLQSDGGKALKMLGTGVVAIVLPPVLIAGAAVASVGVMIYGCGKLLEGIGKGLAVGPETAYKAGVKPQVKRLKRVFGVDNSKKDARGPISI
ncbi:hypothetical protein BD309DRAFT_974113 [Dichomitus squalens]|uniref:Uncharacterized protein n=1 Tax=Dichomitus squalens TaxID=114155 RepID=A0A4Q9PH30_9APHY|nr:hypothetical protein BD311DRAFT_768835 [Dichomitus squalens]TBU37424.1 hypothetical protein BD309DRAFT_974113 [Dichomitus squalens]TBU52752.1 hypothetical protein BD310DRAFT_861380 [Dichomitus squalens]